MYLAVQFSDLKGFSKRNMELMRQGYRFWSADSTIARQAATQFGKPSIVPETFQIPSIGISEYMITQYLLEEFKSSLPSIEDIEAELDDR